MKSNRQAERNRMVDQYVVPHGVQDPAVIAAMRHVPRHRFVPGAYSLFAYVDGPLPIGHGQTISQPSLVAEMTEQLKLKKTDKVLEIGTGSGYQAAILAELVDKVLSVEIVGRSRRWVNWVTRTSGYGPAMATKVGPRKRRSMPSSSQPRRTMSRSHCSINWPSADD